MIGHGALGENAVGAHQGMGLPPRYGMLQPSVTDGSLTQPTTGAASGGESRASRVGGESSEDRSCDVQLRQWLCFCLAKLCWRHRDAQDACVVLRGQDILFACLREGGEMRVGDG